MDESPTFYHTVRSSEPNLMIPWKGYFSQSSVSGEAPAVVNLFPEAPGPPPGHCSGETCVGLLRKWVESID